MSSPVSETIYQQYVDLQNYLGTQPANSGSIYLSGSSASEKMYTNVDMSIPGLLITGSDGLVDGSTEVNIIFDEDAMGSNSATALATQQSIKAYVDSQGGVAGSDTQIQYNNGGSFGGVASLTYNDSTGHITVIDDKKLYFGTGNDASIEYDEDGSNKLIISGAIGGFDIDLPDNVGDVFVISEEGTAYFSIDTTDGDEAVISSKIHNFDAGAAIADDQKLYFGDGDDASIEYDEDGTDELRFAGAAATFEQAVTFDANVTLGNAASDVITSTGQLTASQGATFSGAVFCDSTITVDGAAEFDGSVTLGNAAADVITCTGQLTASEGGTFAKRVEVTAGGFAVEAGAVTFGESGTGSDVTLHGDEANNLLLWDVTENALIVKDGGTETVRMGGDATTDYAVDVGNGSSGTNNINKIRASAFVTFSDERLKTNIVPMTNALKTINSLKPVDFIWKDDDTKTKDFGFTAQDMQKFIPEAVHTAKDGQLGIDYGRLTSILVSAIQEQSAQIAEMKSKFEKD